jgi:segregation and condensation protein A
LADYRVNLDIFAGPLDLLLYLVRKEEVDIYDIPIAKITDQYVKYIEMMKKLDIDVAGDFLVMAATLMQIKSAMLLPRAPGEALGEEDLSDPRAELIRQLLEYKKFKDAANLLAAAADERGERFTRPDTVIEQLKGDSESRQVGIDLDQLSIWDLLEAFDKIMEATGAKFDISNITDDTPIDLYQIEVLHRLQTEGPMDFARIFENRGSRLALVGLFLAVLELIKAQLIWVEQEQMTGAIYLRALTTEPAEEAVHRAIMAAEAASAENGGPDFAQGASPGEQKTEDGGQKREEETQSIERPTSNVELGDEGQQPPIPIVEIPADEGKKPPVQEDTLKAPNFMLGVNPQDKPGGLPV